MWGALGRRASAWAQRWVPEPLVLALLLTLAVALLALPQVGGDPFRVATAWVDGSGDGKGVWGLLAFSMQMCLILLTGHALAESPPVARAVGRLARWPRTTRQAVVLVSVSAMLTAWVSWGLGLVVGALLARDVGRHARDQGRAVHYPLVAAAGYSGMMVWHGGLSGSAPLKVTTEQGLHDVLPTALAAQLQPMPLTATIGSTLNLMVGLTCLVGVPAVLAALAPPTGGATPAPADLTAAPTEIAVPRSPAARLGASPLLLLAPLLLGCLWLYQFARTEGLARLDPNVLNLGLLALGMALHGSPAAYGAAIQRATPAASGILLQYPLYAGIMGIMTGTGLAQQAADLVALAGPTMLPVATFYVAGAVNLVIPSGGGQWAVQGSVLMQAALDQGVEPARLVLALAYGDQWTNLAQPFWALPLLGICRVKAADVLGYTLVLLVVSQLFFVVPVLLM